MSSSKRFRPVVMPQQDAQFPRTPAGASALAVRPSAFDPLPAAYDPPIGKLAPAAPPLPPQGVTTEAEARTVQVPWISPTASGKSFSNETNIYTFTRRWRAVDVYIQDLNDLAPGFIITIRIYALGAQMPPTLVGSGRVGHLQGLSSTGPITFSLGNPVWIAGARAQADRYMVTVTYGLSSGTVTVTDQVSTFTCIGTNEADPIPPTLGAIPFLNSADPAGTAGMTSSGAPQAELLMVQGVVDESVDEPRYLHVHDRAVAQANAPLFCFPLGAGIAAAGGGSFGGTWWFPPGLRHKPIDASASDSFWIIAASSTAAVTTHVSDCVIQGLYR